MPATGAGMTERIWERGHWPLIAAAQALTAGRPIRYLRALP